jgi:hypothetical protein
MCVISNFMKFLKKLNPATFYWGLVLWCLTPFSTIFQFYRGGLFIEVPVYQVRKMSGHSTVTTCSVNSCKYTCSTICRCSINSYMYIVVSIYTCSKTPSMKFTLQYLSFIVAVFLLYQCTKLGKWAVMYMCAKMIDLSFISTIVLLE